MEKLSDGEMNASPETRTDMESIIYHISGPMEQNKKQQTTTKQLTVLFDILVFESNLK